MQPQTFERRPKRRSGHHYRLIITAIRQAREDCGWTQAETAEKIDTILAAWGETGRIVSQQRINELEHGRRRIDAVELLAIASLFKIKLDGFLVDPSSSTRIKEKD